MSERTTDGKFVKAKNQVHVYGDGMFNPRENECWLVGSTEKDGVAFVNRRRQPNPKVRSWG